MNYRHGLCGTRIYRIYNNMKTRCYNPKATRFEQWGGKGVTICSEWLEDFMNFYNWAINNGYTDELTIDRINNNEGYSPENCRWVDYKIQNNNHTNNRKITYRGETLNSKQMAEKYGLKRTTFEERLKKGWDIEKALTPVGGDLYRS